MKIVILLFLVILVSSQLPKIFPDRNYNQTTASSRACFANCQFCQIRTGFCEECLSPYFQKDVNGNCVLINGYIVNKFILLFRFSHQDSSWLVEMPSHLLMFHGALLEQLVVPLIPLISNQI